MSYNCPNKGGGGKGYGGGGKGYGKGGYGGGHGGQVGAEVSFGDVSHEEITMTVRCRANEREMVKELLRKGERPSEPMRAEQRVAAGSGSAGNRSVTNL